MLKKYVFTIILLACFAALTSCAHETQAASDPVPVPVSVLGELQELRALREQLRQDNERS